MNPFLWPFFIIVCCIGNSALPAANPSGKESLIVEAAQAFYDGNVLNLNGNVQLDHDLGKITAQQIQITPHQGEKKIEKGILTLLGDVSIHLREGGVLSCAKACIDFRSSSGVFEGDSIEPDVIYRENCKDKSKPYSTIPMILKSKKMTMEMAKEGSEADYSSKSRLSRILAENEVVIDYNQDFIAQADYASFDKEPQTTSSPSGPFPGIIALRTRGEDNLCKVTNRNGDLIQAKQICIDTNTKQIGFAYPEGFILTNRMDGNAKEEKIEFKADILTWDDQKQQLIFKEHVVLEQKGFLVLTNEEQIQITTAFIQQKRQLKTIESKGKTVLTGFEKLKNKEHHLTCYGKTTVDHEHLLILMESPPEVYGKVGEDQQIFFEDDLGQIYADKLSFQYQMENKLIVPKKMILEGNVRMLNSYAAGPDPTSPLIRYVLADKVEYDPQTKEAIFSSMDSRKRVLFYDKSNDMEVSATSLKIKRDEITKKETIKGIGDVRFSFIENEFEQLKNRFSLDKFKDKNNHADK